MRDSLTEDLMQFIRIPCISIKAGYVKGPEPFKYLTCYRLLLRSALRKSVILDDYQHRKRPLGHKVGRFIYCALSKGTFTDKATGYIVSSFKFLRYCKACRYRDKPTLDTVTEKTPFTQMLASAPSSADAGLTAHYLSDQFFDPISQCYKMSMTAVITEHIIILSKKFSSN